jgi:hypothetical protein
MATITGVLAAAICVEGCLLALVGPIRMRTALS